jgi:hypothetical protein
LLSARTRPITAAITLLTTILAALLVGVGSASAEPVPPAPPAAPATAPATDPPVIPLVSGTPCAATAKACVDLSSRQAWLTDGAGHVTYGPVGALGGTRSNPTPTGTFSVDYKDRDHVSNLFDADMPNAVFFAPAIAFHQGSLSQRSHGCIHLGGSASRTFFSRLAPGDSVEVVS